MLYLRQMHMIVEQGSVTSLAAGGAWWTLALACHDDISSPGNARVAIRLVVCPADWLICPITVTPCFNNHTAVDL